MKGDFDMNAKIVIVDSGVSLKNKHMKNKPTEGVYLILKKIHLKSLTIYMINMVMVLGYMALLES